MTSKDFKRQLRQQQAEAFERQQRAAAKEQRRAEKALARLTQETADAAPPVIRGALHCACLIHSTGYDWTYVDRLYSMLCRHISRPIKLHVWTEASRVVPDIYIKHALTDWPDIVGPRKSWWYKLQMFDPAHAISDAVLYFDLDVVIVNNLDWMLDLPMDRFWAVRDFRYLWRTDRWEINSSVMRWTPGQWHWIWEDFSAQDRPSVIKRFAGDQDYLNSVISKDQIGWLDQQRLISYRWQAKDGGWDNHRRVYRQPGSGTEIPTDCSVLVFHGTPKPHQVHEHLVLQHWT